MSTGGIRGYRHGLVHDRRGAAAMELALLLPVMTAFIFGVIQYGTLYYTYDSMQNAARNGTRAMAEGSLTAAGMKTKALGALPKWVDSKDWVIVAVDTPAAGSKEVKASISVASNKATVLSFVPMPASIGVDVVMDKEP